MEPSWAARFRSNRRARLSLVHVPNGSPLLHPPLPQHLLAGKGAESFRNFGVSGVQGSASTTPGGTDTLTAFFAAYPGFLGTSFSYVWWIVAFQFVVGVLLPAAAAVKPAIRKGSLLLITVLTTSTFLLTNTVCNAAYGAYAISHNQSGTAATVSGRANELIMLLNGILALFSGLVIVDVANAATLFLLGNADESAAEAPAAPAKDVEAPAASE